MKREQQIDQAAVEMKIRLGWMIIVIFLMQNMIVMYLALKIIIPKFVEMVKAFAKYLKQLYYLELHYQCIIPLYFSLINHASCVFPNLSNNKMFTNLKAALSHLLKLISDHQQ